MTEPIKHTGGTSRPKGLQRTIAFLPKGPVRYAILGMVGLICVFALYSAVTSKPTDAILTATAKRGPFDVVVVETGELEAKRSVTLTTPVLSGGREQLAIQYLAQEGTTVDSGKMVVVFDPADAMKQIDDKSNELKLAQADLDKTKVQQKADESEANMNFENSKLSFELAKLANDEMKFESEAKQRESQLELRKAELAYKQSEENVTSKAAVRKSELSNLQLKISQLQNVLTRVQGDMERLNIKAPASGLVVLQRSWNTGKKLTKGDQVWGGQPLIQLPDLTDMQAKVSVNEVDISKVKKDQAVEITLDAFPDKKFPGKVTAVANIGNPKDNNPSVKVFEVMVAVTGADSVLKPGMTVSARITVSKITNVVSVPIEAVFDDKGKPVVYVRTSSSFDKRPVVLGAKNDNFVVVTSGLKEGETVSLSDPTKADEKKKSKDGANSKPKV